MSPAPGTRLGPYEILAPLGAGGMGEVWRARDSRLAREVAVKVLPAALAASPEVRARFEREAKTISALNHPHICTLFDVGRENGVDFLVMELVDGETLAHRLSRGALPAPDVLKLGAQIADALDRAHRAGVVHRDLKPGNVMLTKSGAKLMDFGLARPTGLAAATSGLTSSPTVARSLTAEGTLVGTFQYMAPEQLEGKEADARSDLWALGCVLHEMATGQPAFAGRSQASLISAIMSAEPPPITQTAPMSPPALERLVKQCLAKDPDDRWQSAGDVRRELEWIAGASASGATAVAAPGGRPPLPRAALAGLALAALAIVAIAVALGWWARRPAAPPLTRFTIEPPEGTSFPAPAEAALSPDGSQLAFESQDSTLTNHVYVRRLEDPQAHLVPGTGGASLPFWSPDGRSLGFFASGKLRTVALDGSAPVAVCDAPNARGGSWSRTGVILFAPNAQSGIERVAASGGTPEIVTRPDSARHELGHRYPQFLPDGRHFLYVAVGSGEQQVTWCGSLDGGAPVEVCRAGSGAVYAEPGWILYLDSGVNSPQRRLVARRFDPGSCRASGEPQVVLADVKANNFGYANATAAGGGALAVQHWTTSHSRLVWRDRRGVETATVSDDFDGGVGGLSRDGGRFAYGGGVASELYVLDLDGGVATRLTSDGHIVANEVWSPDGRRIAYGRLTQDHGWEIRVRAADGNGADSLVFRAAGLINLAQAWSADGRWLVAVCSDSSGDFDLWRIPMTGGGHAERYERTPGQEQFADVSPDGHWVAVVSTEETGNVLDVESFPDPGTRHQVPIADAQAVLWPTADELLVVDSHLAMSSVPISTVGGFHAGAPRPLFQVPRGDLLTGYDVARKRFLGVDPRNAAGDSRLEFVLGWPRLLERR